MPQPNASLELQYRVQDADLASKVALDGRDAFPEVFATSRMVALMEVAAARLLAPELGAGQLSVGVEVEIKHTAATAVGESVTAKATFLGMEGKFYRFSVELFDAAGLAGSGYHTRAIIDSQRLLDGARKRRAA